MTKQQAKQFAKLFIGSKFYEYRFFDKNLIDCPDEDKQLIQTEINAALCKMLGNISGYLSPQEIYELSIEEQ